MRHIVWDEQLIKISPLKLFWFGIDSVLNIFPQTMTHLIDEAVYRTAPATPGLLIIELCKKTFISTRLFELHECLLSADVLPEVSLKHGGQVRG